MLWGYHTISPPHKVTGQSRLSPHPSDADVNGADDDNADDEDADNNADYNADIDPDKVATC
jgi:hypothetical protein